MYLASMSPNPLAIMCLGLLASTSRSATTAQAVAEGRETFNPSTSTELVGLTMPSMLGAVKTRMY